MKGLLVVIEGIDGSGKSTQAAALLAELEARGVPARRSHEPTGGPYGTELRRSAKEGRLDLEREVELFLLDREEHVRTLIRPAVQRGEVVILDRYYFSTIAYQGARGADPEALRRRNEAIAPRPDLLVLLDLDVATGLARVRGRGDSPDHFEQQALLERTRALFLRFADAPWALKLDASRPAPELTAAILERLLPLLDG